MSTSNVILKNSITALGLFYINNSLRTILCDTRTGIKTIGFFCPQHPNWDQNLQFPPLNQHPASRACFRLYHFDALEKDCLSRERSLLNMRCIWYGFKPLVRGLSYDHRFANLTDSRTRKSVWWKKTWLTHSEVRAAVTSNAWRGLANQNQWIVPRYTFTDFKLWLG